MAGDVEEVLEVLVAVAQERPGGAGAFIDVTGLALFRVIAQEGAVQTGVRVLNQLHLEIQQKNRVNQCKTEQHHLQLI